VRVTFADPIRLLGLIELLQVLGRSPFDVQSCRNIIQYTARENFGFLVLIADSSSWRDRSIRLSQPVLVTVSVRLKFIYALVRRPDCLHEGASVEMLPRFRYQLNVERLRTLRVSSSDQGCHGYGSRGQRKIS
jgi:hypothetical protein